MNSALIEYYVRKHPREAASVIEHAGARAVVDFLSGIDPSARAQILTCLLPTTVRAFLIQANPDDVAASLNMLRAGATASLLQSLRHSERSEILDRLTEEKRDTVRHQLRYPSDSVGAILMTPTAACRASATVRHAKRIVRRLASAEAPLLVVLDDRMRPGGALDFSELLRLREREIVGERMRSFPQRFPVRSAIHSVAEHSAWDSEDYLPAVEHDERFVGIISKSRLLNYLAVQRSEAADADEMTQTLIALGELFWKPAAEFFARAATGRAEDL